MPKDRRNKLKTLDLNFSKAVNNKNLEKIVKSFPELITLNLSGCIEVTIPGLMAVDKHLKNLQRLRLLDLNVQYVKELLTNQFPLQEIRFLHVGPKRSSVEVQMPCLTLAEVSRFFVRMPKLRTMYLCVDNAIYRHETDI